MTKKVLNLFDAAWFFVERKDAPAHFGPLIILSPPEGADPAYVRALVERWRGYTKFAPPFNYVFRADPVPSWNTVADDEIELDHHLRHAALPAPGGERELQQLVSQLHSLPLDRSRPLWECHVIEGLSGGRFAIYFKLHHGQLDGVAAARLFSRTLSVDPADDGQLPIWSVGARRPSTASPSPSAEGAPAGPLARFGKALGGASASAHALIRMASAGRAGSAEGPVLPFQAPMTPLNQRIGNRRSFVALGFELARLRVAANAADVTVNDVFLSVFAGALDRYLRRVGEVPDGSIIGQIPMNVRGSSDSGIGNALSFLYAPLHSDIADPVVRLQAVHRSTRAAKGVYRRIPQTAMGLFTIVLSGPQMAVLIAGLGGRGRPAANLVISNVPGPDDQLYLSGARVDEICGPSVLFHGQALNVTMATYAGRAVISMTACSRSVPHLEQLAEYTEAVLVETEHALGIENPEH
ncbi:wax ester/triacylglycerol synthase family O-acyltransferase [Nocardia sp. R7R-8]|uniref:wax ester/triacylglycerol synthase family O-acyltransferase n=1 Tax=Nocardia sp. R7R-8 TaxID=3459304 RepID=UPI00403DCF91